MSKLIIVRGIQGSGKSTWAKAWAKEEPTKRIRWNQDDLRNMFGEYWVPEREKTGMLKILKEAFVAKAMKSDLDIVMDDMNLNPSTLTEIKSLVDKYNLLYSKNYEIETKTFYTPVDECIRRDAQRSNPIGASVIKATWKRYRDMLLKEQNEEFAKQFLEPNYSKSNIVIFDLDGTIAYNVKGRPFYGKGCAEGISKDVADPRMLELIHTIRAAGRKVGFLTGREDTPEIRKATEDWLKAHGIDAWEFLLMRPQKTFDAGDVCKENLYHEFIEPKYNVIAVYEDSQKVVNMWRKLGILCLQPNDGNC